jgi:hypothetical protein
MFGYNVYNLISEIQQINIFFSGYIELLKIYINFQVSIFVGTTTIGDNQIVFSTSLIKLTTSKLFIFV